MGRGGSYHERMHRDYPGAGSEPMEGVESFDTSHTAPSPGHSGSDGKQHPAGPFKPVVGTKSPVRQPPTEPRSSISFRPFTMNLPSKTPTKASKPPLVPRALETPSSSNNGGDIATGANSSKPINISARMARVKASENIDTPTRPRLARREPSRAEPPPPPPEPPKPKVVVKDMAIYHKISMVGEGTYGKVYKAKNNLTKELVALKQIRMEGERDGVS